MRRVAIFTLACLLLVLPLGSQSRLMHNSYSGLAAWWKLIGDSSATATLPTSGTTVYDSSGHSISGTFSGTKAGGVSSTYYTVTCGEFPYCATFDGSTNYVITGTTSASSFSSGITVMAWFNTSTITTQEDIVTRYASSADLLEISSTGKTRCAFNLSTTSVNYTGGTTVSANAWNLFACTYSVSSGQMTEYLNTSVVGTATGSGTLSNTASTWYIGQLGTGSRYFHGEIAMVRIWNFPLTANQVYAIRSADTAMMDAPPWWRQDQLFRWVEDVA